MSSEEILSSINEIESGEVEDLTSSEGVSTEIMEEDDIIEEEVSEILENNSELLDVGYDISETSTETKQEVIYQVADLTKVENSLGIITCFVIFFSVFFLGSMVYRLVKDIFY